MSNLPPVSGWACVHALEKVGFHLIRRSRGTHLYVQRDNPLTHISIPDHKTLKPGTLRSIIRQAGLTVDQFVKLL